MCDNVFIAPLELILPSVVIPVVLNTVLVVPPLTVTDVLVTADIFELPPPPNVRFPTANESAVLPSRFH